MASATYHTQPQRPFHPPRSASFPRSYDYYGSTNSVPRSRSKSSLNINHCCSYDFYDNATRDASGFASSSGVPPKRSRTPATYEEDTRRAHRRRAPVVVEDDIGDRPHPHHTGHGHGLGHGHTRSRTKSYSHLQSNSESSTHQNAYNTFPLHHEGEEEYKRSQNDHATSDFDSQVRLWMIQDEMRRLAAEREAMRTRLVQNEIRRIQANLFIQREAERLRLLEEMDSVRAGEDRGGRERARRQKASPDRIMSNAWMVYERNWAAISSPSSSEPLSFMNIPWPMLHRPSSPSSITLPAISAFLLSETHSTSQKPKERIKEALRRWHPDRFVRFLGRVPPEERGMVEEAVGIVARCLNEMMGRYSE